MMITRVRYFLGAWLSLCCLHAAGTVQQSISQLGTTNNWVLAFRWTGDASSGAVSATTAQLGNCCAGYLITQVETVPGSPAPTNGYSVAIQDSAGVDALNGAAAAASSSTAQSFAASTASPPVQGTFSLVITGQNVASAKGTVYVFLSKPGTINFAAISGGGASSSANWLTIANAPFLDARRYNFTAQSPGGTLSAGVPATVKITEASGLNGTDTTHYLWVAGTGTPEAVLITGGSSTSIQFTPANSHGAGWTIQSATGGVQEAVQVIKASASQQGVIWVGVDGAVTLYGPLTITGVQVRLLATSTQAIAFQRDTTFNWDSAIKIYDSGSAAIDDMQMIGRQMAVPYPMVKVYAGATSGVLHMHRVIIIDGQYGIISDSSGTTELDNVYVLNGDDVNIGIAGIKLDCTTGNGVANNIIFNSVYTAFYGNTYPQTGLDVACVDGLQVSNSGFTGQRGVAIEPTNGRGGGGGKYVWNVFFSNTFIDNVKALGLVFASTGAGQIRSFVYSGGSINCEAIGSAGVDFGWTYGAPDLDNVTIEGVHIGRCTTAGVALLPHPNTPTTIRINGNTVYNNGVGITARAGTVGVQISGNKSGANGGGGQAAGVSLLGAFSGMVEGNDLCDNTTALLAGGAITGIVRNNRCVDEVIPAVASAATLAFPVNPNFTITGNTNMTAATLTNVPAGVSGTLRCTAAAPTVTAGGGWGNSFTCTQNALFTWIYDGTSVWVK